MSAFVHNKMPRSRLTTVNDLFALSDAQLGDFMKKHRRSDGAFVIRVDDDWDKLSKEDRNRLAERLQAVSSNASPLDLDKLNALLLGVSNREDCPSQTQPRARERETESRADEREIYRQLEMKAYNNLVNDGGRPLYTADLLESVSKNPDAYYEMLKPFWRQPRYDKCSEMDHSNARSVFRRQWHRQQNFRKWQLDNRNIKDEDDGFLAIVERVKRRFQEVGDLERVAEIEADPTILKRPGEPWYHVQRHRDWQRRYQREPECKDFSHYEDAVKKRLNRHGFTRVFHLQEDPKQQDELTTWIEYLGFEYWWLDRYTATFERLKLKHDEAWEVLTKSGTLQDDETPDFVRTDASGTRTQNDKDRTRKTLQDAESEAKEVYRKTQMDSNRLSIPAQQRVQMLAKARKKLLAAREAYDLAKRRSRLIVGFVRGTFDYDDTREDVANQMRLLEWAVAEAQAIETERKSAILEGSSQQKRKASDDVCSALPDAKKRKPNGSKV
ncbi:hypothetical protein C2857_000320 [Epichloe festucae Fl1]|uniref:Uncharacterized protein n=1 Tax=Epichloe festucae (strain Fl1) TaxID=877507 RepID=A0A7S9KVE8_EPIFF|nr:hypothetical protein C2857_000320 [Epichloe festucae Fl1]